MLNAYEIHLLNKYIFNISEHSYRSWEPENLVEWLDEYLKVAVNPNEASDGVFMEMGKIIRPLRLSLEKKSKKGTFRPRQQQTREGLLQVGELLRSALACRLPRPDRPAIRLLRLAKAMGLDSLDIEILELLLRYHTNPVFKSFFDDVFSCYIHHNQLYEAIGVSSPAIPMCLGWEIEKYRSRLRRDSPLLRMGLLRINAENGELELLDRLSRLSQHEPGRNGEDIIQLLLDTASPSELEWSDFDHVAEHRDHIEALLKGALKSRAKGVNILLYGRPGTGKTEFCKVLAKRLGVALREISEVNEDVFWRCRNRCRNREQELVFAQRLLANNSDSLLLFDEMTDLLEGAPSFAGFFPLMAAPRYSAAGSQISLHRMLEESTVPMLWTMNDARWVNPAILRRMMFALELREPGSDIRTRVWARQLAKNDIAATPEEVRELAREFSATPAIAAGATRAAQLGGGELRTVRAGVRSLSRLLSLRPPQKAPDEFELGLIAADTDPESLADRIASTARRDFSLCLQGPPGTGKSAFARYLAERLGLETMHRRASDLMSMWVGESEKNIAGAFAEARDSEAFLVFDEADSLLSDRRNASRNWEVSQVNEMLTWMESHPLPFACTTNFVDRLDEATLRRFTFKVALDYLTPAQARLAFDKFFSLEAPAELHLIAALTPGDFAVVRKKAEILGCLGEPRALLDMLRAECAAKPDRQKKIGFLA